MGGSFILQNPHCRQCLIKNYAFEWRETHTRQVLLSRPLSYTGEQSQARDAKVQLVSQLWHDTLLCRVTWTASAEEPSSTMKNQLSAWTASSWPCCNSKARSCLRQQAASASTVAGHSGCFPRPWKPRELLLPPVRAELECMGFPGHQDRHPSSNCHFLHSFQSNPHPIGWYRSSKPGSLGLSILALLLSFSYPYCLLLSFAYTAELDLGSWIY